MLVFDERGQEYLAELKKHRFDEVFSETERARIGELQDKRYANLSTLEKVDVIRLYGWLERK